MSSDQTKMLSIWFFVSIVIGVFGVVVTGVGFYHMANPEVATSVLAELNPALWWGAVMMVFAILLFLGDRLGGR